MRNRAILLLVWALTIWILSILLVICSITLLISPMLATRTRKTNCIQYAFSMWAINGGYIAIRKSRFGWYPHFIWLKDVNGKEMSHIGPASGLPAKDPIDFFVFDSFIKTDD